MRTTSLRFAILTASLCAFAAGCGGASASVSTPQPPIVPIVATATPSPAPLSVTPGSLSFAATGVSSAQTFAAGESGYTGSFSESDTCGTIAKVTSPASPAGPSATYTVTPQAAGSCTVTIKDAGGQTASVSVTVSPPALVLTPSSLSFTAAGAAAAQTFTAGDNGYTGTFTESDTCSPAGGTVATVTPAASSSGPSATYTVTPQASGSCTITITDANSHSASVSVGVTLTQGGIN